MGVRPRGRVQTKSNLTKSFNGRVDGQQQRSSTAVTKAEEGCSKDGPPVVLLKDPPPHTSQTAGSSTSTDLRQNARCSHPSRSSGMLTTMPYLLSLKRTSGTSWTLLPELANSLDLTWTSREEANIPSISTTITQHQLRWRGSYACLTTTFQNKCCTANWRKDSAHKQGKRNGTTHSKKCCFSLPQNGSKNYVYHDNHSHMPPLQKRLRIKDRPLQPPEDPQKTTGKRTIIPVSSDCRW